MFIFISLEDSYSVSYEYQVSDWELENANLDIIEIIDLTDKENPLKYENGNWVPLKRRWID